MKHGSSRLLPALALCVPGALMASTVTRTDDAWLIENRSIQVRIDPGPGHVSVLDKRSGYRWRPPRASAPGADKLHAVREIHTPPKIDGDPTDWTAIPLGVRIPHTMTADAKKVDSDADCSARVRTGWDAKSFYFLAEVRDDDLEFAAPGRVRWWDKDSVEFWLDSTQIGLNLSPQGCQGRNADTRIGGIEVAMKPMPGGDGYVVEARVPWSVVHIPVPRPGRRFRFAVGVNDADAGGTREGQLYFPGTWRHSDPATFAGFALADSTGRIPAKQTDASVAFRDVEPVTGPAGLRFKTSLRTPQKLEVILTLTVPDDEADLVVDIDMADRSMKIYRQFAVLPPLLLDTPDAALAVADYCNGHLYPLNASPFPRGNFFNGNRLDMPWVGILDVKKGFGYALILDTSDDCGVRLRRERTAKGWARGPVVEWWASKRVFRYPRRMRYRFRGRGGYVALAKAYRSYARGLGLLKTLARKAKENPNVRRLFGAPDVWGNASFEFARQAKALGVEKMLIHGESARENMEKINKLGYLTSRYDNYTDILQVKEGEKVRNNRGRIPDDVTLRADGKRQTAWLTFDKKTQFMKRCPALWVDTAKQYIPGDLATHPYLARFIDVTTAEALYECFDPKHPLTRTEKRHCGEQLEQYVWDLGLVGGGEHGLWWGVPAMCYVEGMMSGGNYSWPAGHLRHPKTKEDHVGNPWGHKLPPFSQYEKYGIGHEFRVPLWELVFHDCIVTTWYWGDASDWLLDAAPEITPKKDAFNILYATIPLVWADRNGAWIRDRNLFLRTIRNTCKLHEQIAGEEMLSHEFVTTDRAVQRTVFSSGTEVVVNFGDHPRKVTVGGSTFLLPKNGFAVHGPRIRQSLSIEAGKPVTVIETADYRYEERNGRGVTLSRHSPGRIRVTVTPGKRPTLLHPERLASAEWTPKHWLLYKLDPAGKRAEWIARADTHGTVAAPAAAETAAFELLYGPAANRSDPAVIGMERKNGSILAVVRNLGYGNVRTNVAFYLDRIAPDRLLTKSVAQLPGGPVVRDVRVTLSREDRSRLAGFHNILCALLPEPPNTDLCTLNNRAHIMERVRPEPDFWDGQLAVRFDSAGVNRVGQVLHLRLDLGEIADRLHLESAIDPNSIRVTSPRTAGKRGRFLLSEFVPDEPVGAKKPGTGTLYWAPVDGDSRAAGVAVDFTIVFKAGDSRLWAPACDHWEPETQTVRMPGYVLRFTNGVPTSLRPVVAGKPGPDFLESLIYSSEKTGWSFETDSKVLSMTCLADGPLRCVVQVKKALRTGMQYTKTYTFYPDRFDLEIEAARRSGCILSRAHYRLPGKYIDDKGVTAEIDGKGDENRNTYGKNRAPEWYAVLGKGWAQSCVARGRYGHMAYWDGGHMGAIGFVDPADTPARMTYFIHGAQSGADFARRDWQQTTVPPRCRLLWP